MKEQLIKFLKSKQTVFQVEEINQIIAIVSQLDEPKLKSEPKKK